MYTHTHVVRYRALRNQALRRQGGGVVAFRKVVADGAAASGLNYVARARMWESWPCRGPRAQQGKCLAYSYIGR